MNQRHIKLVNLLSLVFMFTFLFVVYLSNFKIAGSGDTIAARYIPYNIWKNSRTDLTNFEFFRNKNIWYLKHSEKKTYSIYPPGTYLMTVPFVILAQISDFMTVPVYTYSVVNLTYEKSFLWPVKIAAAFYSALGILLLFMFLRRHYPLRTAYLTAMTIGLGSSVISICAQDMWQHTAIFPTVSLLLLLSGTDDTRKVIAAGFTGSFMMLIRPTTIFITLMTGLTWYKGKRKKMVLYFLTFLLSWLFLGYFKRAFFPSGGYLSSINLWDYFRFSFYVPVWKGLAGLLFSPSRGLLFYSPVLLFSLFYPLFSKKTSFIETVSYLIVWVYLIFYAMNRVWTGGWSGGGYRYLIDVLPLMGVLLAGMINQSGKVLRIILSIFILWSVFIHLNLFFFSDYSWDKKVIPSQLRQSPWQWMNQHHPVLHRALSPDPFLFISRDNKDYERIRSGNIDPGHYDRRWVWSISKSQWMYYIFHMKNAESLKKYWKKFMFLILLTLLYLFVQRTIIRISGPDFYPDTEQNQSARQE